MSIGPIPFVSIDAFADRYGLHGADEFEAFRSLIRQMDAVYLKWAGERQKPKNKDS